MTVKYIPYRRRYKKSSPPTHIARVMSPSGVYPDRTIATEETLFFIERSICFSVVKYDDEENTSLSYYSEVEWASMREIAFYSTILLSTKREESYVAIYPYRYPFHLYVNESLQDKRVQRKIKNTIVNLLGNKRFEIYAPRGMATPPVVNGDAYDLRKNSIRQAWVSTLASAIDINDHLLIRGLSTLLRAIMLWQHHHFAEEAINTLFISLDASFQIILRKLEAKGNKNPTAVDAGQYISHLFYEESTDMRYFEGFYESRIMSLHPKSRFGIFPHAPLYIDDFTHLRDSLIEIYANLIGGLVRPDVLDFAKNANRRSDQRLYGDSLRLKRQRNIKLREANKKSHN